MSPTAKLLTTAITGVGGGVGAYYAKQYLSKESKPENPDLKPQKISISEQIKKKGRNLLNNNSTLARWEIKLNTYLKEKTKLNIKLEPENVETLRTTCESKLTFESNEENKKLFEDLEKICTSPTNNERLQKENKELVKGDQEWEKKAENYRNNSNGTNAIDSIKKETASKEDMEKWCNAKIEKEYEDDDDYSKLLKWCIDGEN